MQLTYFSDYALRIALYLAMNDDRLVSAEEISAAYGVSRNHLVKVVQLLARIGVVTTVRGRAGGLRLAVPPAEINIGRVVRATEGRLDLVECFDPTTNTCPIAPACGLKRTLKEARAAFLRELDAHTLAEYLPRRAQLVSLWSRAGKSAAGASTSAAGGPKLTSRGARARLPGSPRRRRR